MQKIFLKTSIILSFTALFFYGCAPQNPITPPTQPKQMTSNTLSQTIDVDQDFVLSPGQEAVIKDTDIAIYFLDLENDSRCPLDAPECYEVGTVNTSIKVSKNGQPLNKAPLSISLGGHQDINDDYTLKLSKVDPVRAKMSQQIPKAEYRATFKLELKHKPLPVPVTELSKPSGAIFPKESLPPHDQKQFEGVGIQTIALWNPTVDDAKEADQIVKTCIANKEKVVEDKLKDYTEEAKKTEKDFYLGVLQKIEPAYADYVRQYIGYTHKNGHQLIWINFFLPDDAKGWDWKKEIVQPPMTAVRSGYHGFFEALVDLNDKSCFYFKLGV